ncbi:hypothetical protein AYI70_g5123, partial [Smittium culicis]
MSKIKIRFAWDEVDGDLVKLRHIVVVITQNSPEYKES